MTARIGLPTPSAFSKGRLLNTNMLPIIVNDEHDDGGDENGLEPSIYSDGKNMFEAGSAGDQQLPGVNTRTRARGYCGRAGVARQDRQQKQPSSPP
jgi:hypothetical protein